MGKLSTSQYLKIGKELDENNSEPFYKIFNSDNPIAIQQLVNTHDFLIFKTAIIQKNYKMVEDILEYLHNNKFYKIKNKALACRAIFYTTNNGEDLKCQYFPFIFACKEGDIKFFNIFLQFCADLEEMLSTGEYLGFDLVCEYNHFELAQHFLKIAKNLGLLNTIFNNNPYFFALACRHGNYEIVDLLIKEAPKEKKQILFISRDFEGLILSVIHKHYKVADLIINNMNMTSLVSFIHNLDKFFPITKNDKHNFIESLKYILPSVFVEIEYKLIKKNYTITQIENEFLKIVQKIKNSKAGKNVFKEFFNLAVLKYDINFLFATLPKELNWEIISKSLNFPSSLSSSQKETFIRYFIHFPEKRMLEDSMDLENTQEIPDDNFNSPSSLGWRNIIDISLQEIEEALSLNNKSSSQKKI
ncbi:MAG: hypothetical protein J0H68_03530 [Sphingobacteriia bacterium]|nr:hypothetical protein [Sphingobacteriia bacterium]